MKRSRTMVKKWVVSATISFLLVSLLGCGVQSSNTSSGKQDGAASGPAHPLWYKEPTTEQLKAAQQDNISGVLLTRGVNGEEAFPASQIQMTSDEVAKIQAGNYTAAIAMHFNQGDWPQLALAGLESEFKRLGIKVISTTSANFVDSTQISQIEAIIAKKPDILISAPVNAKTQTNIYKKVAAAGIKLGFMNQPADNLVPGQDYVSVIAPDDFSNGMAAADELAKSMNGKGEVAALYYAPDFNTTNLRYNGFVARLKAKYPDVKLVATAGFDDENKTQGIASALLTKHPTLQGMWVAWDGPALGALAAAKVVGKTPDNFKIVTQDLGSDAALSIAQKSYIVGLGAQVPYDFGVGIAKMTALSLIGSKTYPFISEPSVGVNRKNLEETFQKVHHKPLPSNILSELKK